VFWTLPTAFLSGASAAGGIALINSLGNFGGYAGPQLLGFVKDQTQSFAVALLTLAALMAFAGIVALSLGHNADLEECPRRPARIWTGGVSEPACPSESSRETAGKDDLQEQTVARGRRWTW
jgi:hypothetical protein